MKGSPLGPRAPGPSAPGTNLLRLVPRPPRACPTIHDLDALHDALNEAGEHLDAAMDAIERYARLVARFHPPSARVARTHTVAVLTDFASDAPSTPQSGCLADLRARIEAIGKGRA